MAEETKRDKLVNEQVQQEWAGPHVSPRPNIYKLDSFTVIDYISRQI